MLAMEPRYPNIMSDQPRTHPFWQAVSSNSLELAGALLEKEPSLASKDFRSADEQHKDPYDCRFPLVKACQQGHDAMVELLLQHGADIDAKSPTAEQRGFGEPILVAVESGHYGVANLLLDHGADVNAHGYCSPSIVEELYEAARKVGAPVKLVRKGLEHYLGKTEIPPLDTNAPEVVKLFERTLTLGGIPSLESIVHDRYYELVEELFRKCPEAPGTPHDHPHGTVFVNLCNAGSWGGFPRVFEIAMECCPHLHSPALAKNAISRALVSHNRYGTIHDYEELIETQLLFLKDQEELESTIKDGSLQPHGLLAKNYLWPGWCGPETSPSTAESMIRLTEMFIRYGFDDLNRRDRKSGLTPLAQALERKDHPGMAKYAAYLVEHGARNE